MTEATLEERAREIAYATHAFGTHAIGTTAYCPTCARHTEKILAFVKAHGEEKLAIYTTESLRLATEARDRAIALRERAEAAERRANEAELGAAQVIHELEAERDAAIKRTEEAEKDRAQVQKWAEGLVDDNKRLEDLLNRLWSTSAGSLTSPKGMVKEGELCPKCGWPVKRRCACERWTRDG